MKKIIVNIENKGRGMTTYEELSKRIMDNSNQVDQIKATEEYNAIVTLFSEEYESLQNALAISKKCEFDAKVNKGSKNTYLEQSMIDQNEIKIRILTLELEKDKFFKSDLTIIPPNSDLIMKVKQLSSKVSKVQKSSQGMKNAMEYLRQIAENFVKLKG